MKVLGDAMGVSCYYVHVGDYSGGKYFYLLLDETYVYMSGMSWDRSIVPACPNDYFQ